MRRPDVFTLDYGHPLAQGLVFARLEHERDLGFKRLVGQSVGATHSIDDAGRKISSFAGTSGNGVVFGAPVSTMSVEPLTISAWAMATEDIVNAEIIAFIHNPSVLYRYIALDFARINTTNKVSLRTRFGTGGEYVAYASAYKKSEWMHVIGEIIPNTSQSVYADGVLGEQTTVPQQSSLTATNLNLGTATPFISNNITGSIGDVLIHNRALSPAEIAILADRTDPMLGGLVREVNPVAYFDFGVATTEDKIGPLAITADSSLGLGGIRGATCSVSFSSESSVGIAGIKNVKGAVAFSTISQFICSGILEQSDDKLGAAVFVNESAVGIGGIKKILAGFAITNASALEVGGTSGVLMPELSQASGAAISSSEISGSVYTNKNTGTLYAVATLSSTKPSIAQIQAGQNHLGVSAAYATSQNVTTYGTQFVLADSLSSYTQYYWHFQHKDGEDLDSTIITSSVIRTLDISIPLAFSDSAPATLLTVQVWSKIPKKADVEALY